MIDAAHIARALTYACSCGAQPGEWCFAGRKIPRPDRDDWHIPTKHRDQLHVARLDKGLTSSKRQP